MKSLSVAIAGVAVASLGLVAAGQQAPNAPVAASAVPAVTSAAGSGQTSAPAPARTAAPAPAAAHAPSMPAAQQTELVKTYCATCHSEKAKAGGLSLASFDATRAQEHPEVVEKMIRKVRAGMMPPATAKRPDAAVIASFLGSLETRMDEFAASNPNPGWRPFQRLNRAEYQRAVRDLLGIDIDVSTYLPPDTISHGFDNVADVQTFSPALMEGYLRAASSIAALAVGDPDAAPTESTYKVPRTQSQMVHVEGAPLGTRGGLSTIHVFPADGELYGSTVKGEQLEISIDGTRVALLDINPRMSESSKNGMNIESDRVHITAGPHRVSAAFLERYGSAPVDDLLAPIDYTLADSQIGSGFGVTTLPHIRDFSISGPFRVTGVSDTVSRRRIFSCRPTAASEEAACAESILGRLARQAYRGPVADADLDGLMGFYERGREKGDFESGITTAVEALLASPRFVFRLEQAPATAKTGQTYKLADLELASRLSFFLWGAVPDAELVKVASAGQLSQPAVFAKQVRRMLADPKAEALSTRFASQWLRLQDVDKIRPDALLYPYWDHSLAESMVRETQLLFDSLVREDRSVLDLYSADYTFVNERLAKHYGIPNVTGSQFRRVAVPDERRGLLGQGSILLLSSVADRTSPVQRGKYVMEVVLGTPPPAPPPNVPSLDESVAADKGGKMLSVRERMEQHRANPACNSCHRVIDPLGLALENFDVTGRWRIKDNGVAIDSNGELYDGTKMEGPAGLRAALLKHQDLLLLSFTERLMTYAIGRRMEPYDMPAIRAIIRDAAKNGYKMSSFITGVANSAAFRTTKLEAVETTDAPAAR